LLEARASGQVFDVIAGVGEAAVGAVEITELRLGGDDPLESADELAAFLVHGRPLGSWVREWYQESSARRTSWSFAAARRYRARGARSRRGVTRPSETSSAPTKTPSEPIAVATPASPVSWSTGPRPAGDTPAAANQGSKCTWRTSSRGSARWVLASTRPMR